LATCDSAWVDERLISGIGSGEALIDAFREQDRRALVIESEFSRLLAVISREGCTLSANIRDAWDGGTLSVRTRQNKLHVTGAHLSLVGHITKQELLRRLDDTEIANGFGNRILWICAKRSKTLPFGGGSIDFGSLPTELRAATDHARKMGEYPRKIRRRCFGVVGKEVSRIKRRQTRLAGRDHKSRGGACCKTRPDLRIIRLLRIHQD